MFFSDDFLSRLSGLVGAGATPRSLFLVALVAGTLAFAVASLPSLVALVRRMPFGARVGVAASLVAGVLLRRLTFPDMAFHEDFHLPLLLDRIARAPQLDGTMGHGFAVMHHLVQGLLGGGGERVLFDVQRLVGSGSIVLMGLAAFALTGSGPMASAAALLMAANPIFARLSASEDPVTPFVFLLLSGTLALLLAAEARRAPDGGRPGRWQPAFLVLHAASALALMLHFRTDFAVYLPVVAGLVASVPGAGPRLVRFGPAWAGAVLVGVSVWWVLPEVLHPAHDGFRLVTRPVAWFEALVGAADFRAPNRLVLFSQAVTPPWVPVLAAAGFFALFATRRRLAWALLVPALVLSGLFLGSNGFPGNVRHQAPQHVLFLLAAAAGAAWGIERGFATRAGRTAAAAVFAAITLLSYAGSIRTLAQVASPQYEREFLDGALPQVALGPGTTVVRLEGRRDVGFANTSFPDERARASGARLASVSELLAAAPRMTAADLDGYVFYRGLTCYLADAYSRRQGGPCDTPCDRLEQAYALEPVVERDIPNVPYESMFLYPSPLDQAWLRIGFYRMRPLAPAP